MFEVIDRILYLINSSMIYSPDGVMTDVMTSISQECSICHELSQKII